MKKLLLLLLFSVFSFSQDGLPHCGYDFTTYLVANPIDAITKKIIDGLQITLVDSNGNEVVNTNNEFSLINKDKSLSFSKNYKVTLANSEVRWFYNICEDQYLLQLKANFIPEDIGYAGDAVGAKVDAALDANDQRKAGLDAAIDAQSSNP